MWGITRQANVHGCYSQEVIFRKVLDHYDLTRLTAKATDILKVAYEIYWRGEATSSGTDGVALGDRSATGINAISDPEVLEDWVTIGLYHAEALIRKVGTLAKTEWTNAMRAEDLDMKTDELRRIWREMFKRGGRQLVEIRRDVRKDTTRPQA